jgi:hypothetical protein
MIRERSRCGVSRETFEKDVVLLGIAMLLGIDRERLERRNDVIEKRLFFRSSLKLSVSLTSSSGVVFVQVAVREGRETNSGSSEASREEGIESDRGCGPCIT